MNVESVLVTGCGGPLGYAFKSLSTAGALDIRTEYFFSSSRDANLEVLEETRKLLLTVKPDAVVHAAAFAGSAVHTSRAPFESIARNSKMAINILQASQEVDVRHVILIGSVAAYPLESTRPTAEESMHSGTPSNSDYAYAHAKRFFQPLARAFEEQTGITCHLAITNGIVGPHMRFETSRAVMLASLIKRACEKVFGVSAEERLVVYGDGRPRRQYTCAGDLVNAIEAIRLEPTLPRTLNIGTNETHSVLEWAEMVCKVLSIDPACITLTDRPGSDAAVYHQEMSNKEFVAATGFQYKPAIEGLKSAIAWYLLEHHDVKPSE